jgi:hypothetical protein
MKHSNNLKGRETHFKNLDQYSSSDIISHSPPLLKEHGLSCRKTTANVFVNMVQ